MSTTGLIEEAYQKGLNDARIEQYRAYTLGEVRPRLLDEAHIAMIENLVFHLESLTDQTHRPSWDRGFEMGVKHGKSMYISPEHVREMLEQVASDPVYNHRNGEDTDPEVDGWYWCWWSDDDETLIMEWFEGHWRNDVGGVFTGIMPNRFYGPIPRPKAVNE